MATPSEPILQCPIPRPMAMDPRWRANIEPAPNCPRCASSNTKFCYYNNYSLSQPRYFCKGCRRYWTKGGSLRNVPVGGGCRKTRRSRSKASASSSGGSGPCSGNPSPNSSSGFCQESGGPDIDMAAVFARFLSNDHQSNVNEEINEATNTPSEASHDSFTSSSGGLENGFESHQFPDDVVVFDQEFQMTQEFTPSNHKQLEEDEAIQEFITSDFGAFDDIVDDVFWSDDSNLSSFTWQPVPDLQEFDSPLLPVEQSKISTNLLSYDNWSGFDTMVFEAFPRH